MKVSQNGAFQEQIEKRKNNSIFPSTEERTKNDTKSQYIALWITHLFLIIREPFSVTDRPKSERT